MIKSKTDLHTVVGFNSDLHTVVGFNWFHRIITQNFTRSANRPALLFTLVPLVEIEPAENITLVIEPPEKKFQSHHCLRMCLNIALFQFYYQVLNLGLHKYCCKQLTRHCGK